MGSEMCIRDRVGTATPSPRDQNARQVPFQTCKRKIGTEKKLARQIRRRNRTRRRVKQRERRARLDEAKARSRNSELQVATHNVRTLSLTGKHGADHAEVVLRKCQAVGCDVIGLQETRRPGRTEFSAAEYRVCLLYTSPSPRDLSTSRMPSSA